MSKSIDYVDKLFSNARALIDCDRAIMVKRYGEAAVSFVEKTAELMPEPNADNYKIKSMLLIAYDKGFSDALDMLERVVVADAE